MEITNGSGADNVMTALLTGEADIGRMGCEATIYVYLQGKKDYPAHNRSAYQTGRQFSGGKDGYAKLRLRRHRRLVGAYGQKGRHARYDTAIRAQQQGLPRRRKYHYGLLHTVRRACSRIHRRHGRFRSAVRACRQPAGAGREGLHRFRHRHGTAARYPTTCYTPPRRNFCKTTATRRKSFCAPCGEVRNTS